MMRAMLRYDCVAGGGPMQYASSAKRTCRELRSASEKTATLGMFSSRQERRMRIAISPRFATSSLRKYCATVSLALRAAAATEWRLHHNRPPPLAQPGGSPAEERRKHGGSSQYRDRSRADKL